MAGQDAHDGVLSIAGPIARNAEDLDILLRLTAQVPIAQRGKPLKDCRLLLIADQAVSPVDASVREPMLAAVDTLERAGVTIDR